MTRPISSPILLSNTVSDRTVTFSPADAAGSMDIRNTCNGLRHYQVSLHDRCVPCYLCFRKYQLHFYHDGQIKMPLLPRTVLSATAILTTTSKRGDPCTTLLGEGRFGIASRPFGFLSPSLWDSKSIVNWFFACLFGVSARYRPGRNTKTPS